MLNLFLGDCTKLQSCLLSSGSHINAGYKFVAGAVETLLACSISGAQHIKILCKFSTRNANIMSFTTNRIIRTRPIKVDMARNGLVSQINSCCQYVI